MEELNELYKYADEVNKSRENVNHLFKSHLIDEFTKNELHKKLDERSKSKYIYITKPFLTCDSMGETLYLLMRSLSRKVKDNKVINETKST